jgi:hypothetical protein
MYEEPTNPSSFDVEAKDPLLNNMWTYVTTCMRTSLKFFGCIHVEHTNLLVSRLFKVEHAILLAQDSWSNCKSLYDNQIMYTWSPYAPIDPQTCFKLFRARCWRNTRWCVKKVIVRVRILFFLTKQLYVWQFPKHSCQCELFLFL